LEDSRGTGMRWSEADSAIANAITNAVAITQNNR
jgi:hypothetical protein